MNEEATENTPAEAPASDGVPASAKLQVKRVKSTAEVVAVDREDADASEAPEGTRMETDAGPVQGTNIQGAPREVEQLDAPGITIIRERY